MEFSKRFKVEEVWPAELIAKKPDVKGKTLFDVLFKNGKVNKYPVADLTKVNGKYIPNYTNDESKAYGFYVQKGLFEEYAEFGRGHGHDLADFDTYHEARGLRWPVVKGKETLWRFREGYDPYVKPGEGIKFYGNKDGKANIFGGVHAPGRCTRPRHSARHAGQGGVTPWRDHPGGGNQRTQQGAARPGVHPLL